MAFHFLLLRLFSLLLFLLFPLVAQGIRETLLSLQLLNLTQSVTRPLPDTNTE
jgi:hypothetical protein